MTKLSKNSLVLVADPEFRIAANGLKKLKEIAVAQMGAIGEMETKAAAGGVIAGLTLLRVKASLDHGEWGKWLGQITTSGGNLPPVKRTQAGNYMRLANVFLEKARVTKPDLLALPGDQLLLDMGDAQAHEARAFLAKLKKFVGDCSLNELLIKHDIKSVGLKKELDAQKAEEEKKETPQEPLTAEQLYEQSRDEIGSAIERIENLIFTENRLQYLAGHPELLGVVESLETLAKKLRKAASPLLETEKNSKLQKPNSKKSA